MNNIKNDNIVYVIDSYGLIYKAYFAFMSKPLTHNGINISAVFGFFRNIIALLRIYRPKYMVAAFDSTTKTFRHEMYMEYKKTREKTPEDLHTQVPMIKTILQALNMCILQRDGYEADDVIATVTKRVLEAGFEVRIISSDKDLQQLVNNNCQVLKPNKATGGYDIITQEIVEKTWGIPPVTLLDYLCLTGDSADNVPGVRGVGNMTALKLLTQYHTLDAIYEHISEIKPILAKKLTYDKENAYLSKRLITLNDNVPLDYSLQDLQTTFYNYELACKALNDLGLRTVAKDLSYIGGIKPIYTEALFNNQTEDIIYDDINKNYKEITTQQSLVDFVHRAKNIKVISFDIETQIDMNNTKYIAGIAMSIEAKTAVFIPISNVQDLFDSKNIYIDVAMKILQELFFDNTVTFIMHNAKKILKMLMAHGIHCSAKLYDTMIAAWLLFSENEGRYAYSTQTLSQKYLHLIVKSNTNLSSFTFDRQYLLKKADLTLQLYPLLQKELELKDQRNLFYNMEMKLVPILCDMEMTGIYLDKSKLQKYGEQLCKNIEELQKKIYIVVGREFNIASVKQLQEILFVEFKLPHPKKSKTGWSCDNEVLEEIKSLHPLPALLLDYRKMTKLLSTYIEPLQKLTDSNSRVHPTFVQTGTATGRLSCKEPNLQNIPIRTNEGRSIRGAFMAPNGFELISADYSQIELVVLAHLSGDSALQEAFIKGQDIHSITASRIFNKNIAEITPDMRRVAKVINFGVIYGMSAFRLSGELKISRQQAQAFIDSYFITYPKLKSFIENTIANAKRTGYVSTMFERKRAVFAICSQNKTQEKAASRIAINTPIQGTASDIVKTAMINVSNALKDKPVKLLLQVHDELIFECPTLIVDSVIPIIKKEMENAVALSVPLKVSIEHGSSWGDFH